MGLESNTNSYLWEISFKWLGVLEQKYLVILSMDSSYSSFNWSQHCTTTQDEMSMTIQQGSHNPLISHIFLYVYLKCKLK